MTDRRFPLSWPLGRPRSRTRQRAPFGTTARSRHSSKEALTVSDAHQRLQTELDLLGAQAVVLSTNVELRLDGAPRGGQANPADPGAALYFKLRGRDTVLACDKWDRVADNIAAIAKHVEALRGMDRWGVGTIEQAFAGYQALPAPEQWWQVLDVGSLATPAEIERAYRRLAAGAHPDTGGSDAAMARLNAARNEGLAARSPR